MVDPEKLPDTDDSVGSGPAPIDGLTAEEQAQLDAMSRGEGGAPDGGNVDHSGDEPAGDGATDPDADPDDDGEPEVAADATRDGTAAADGEPQRKPKTISYGRHQKELAKAAKDRADLQSQLDASRGETKKEREDRIALNARTQMLLDAISAKPAPAAAAAPAVPEDPEPNADEDPIGHSQWKIRKLEKTISDIQDGTKKQAIATEAETEERSVMTALDADISRAIAADPTFTDAFVHLRETRFTELGYLFANIDINDKAQCASLTSQQQATLSQNIQRAFLNEQLMVAREAIKSERSPAAVIANLAKARGFKPKAPDADAGAAAGGDPPPRAGNGAAKPANGTGAAPAGGKAPSVKDQLNAVRDNLEASRSLSDAGGSPGANMTPQRMAEMSPEEFERYYDSIPKDQLDRMMGKVPQ